jgi:hypothetical protein
MSNECPARVGIQSIFGLGLSTVIDDVVMYVYLYNFSSVC